ncbi:hypothetical protein RMATCC62417_06283 [Rhizopus microsporus]|nr:hypothetical protein RMATCC62417_06283 [Rhizopus microsporus]
MRKRQRTAAEASNEVACSTFEAIMDKIAVAANSSRAISGSSTENDNSDFDRISEGLEDYIFEKLDEKFVFLDKDISSSLNETVSILTDRTKLSQRPLTNACRSLLNKLTSCAPSA